MENTKQSWKGVEDSPKVIIDESKIKELIRKNFPFPEYRESQEDVLVRSVKAITEKKVVVIRADVGFGKSPVADCLGRIYGNTYYVTPQKILQRQLMKDFSKDMALVLGRPNFDCKVRSGYSCSEGMCQVKGKYKCDPEEVECDYKVQRDAGLESNMVLMNFAYFMLSGEIFQNRKTIIVDECHNIPNLALEYVSMTLSEKDVGQIPHEETESDGGIVYDKLSFQEYVEWLSKTVIPAVTQNILEIQSKIDVTSNDKELDELSKQKRKNDTFKNRIERLTKDWEKYKEEWAVELFFDKKDVMHIKFQPITVGRFLKSMIWNRAENIILMSGTIPNVKRFLYEIGLADRPFEDILVKSTFPVEHRPVIFYPCGYMTMNEKKYTLPKMAKVILKILQKHKDVKGIVHCHSYQNAEMLYDYLGDVRNRLILQDRDGRESGLKEYMESKEPKVFLSVNFTEGLDLKDDLCRFQILMKVPYPYLGDERIRIRVQERKEWYWYNDQTILAVCQAYGRAVRSKDDFAVFYILDESFETLRKRNRDSFNASFLDALRITGKV